MPAALKTREVELKDALAKTRTEIEEIAASFKDETGNGQFVVTSDQHKSYLSKIQEAKDIKSAIDAEVEVKSIFEWMDNPAGTSTAAHDAGQSRLSLPEMKSLSDLYFESDAYAEAKGSDFRRLGQSFHADRSLYGLSHMSVKDLYSASGGQVTLPGFGTPQNLGLTPRTLRPGRVRDLFPVRKTTAPVLYGMRELGFVNNARAVAERTAANGGLATGGTTDVYGLKPMSQIDIQPVTYPIATIAHLHTAHKNVLADEPRLRGVLDIDMMDGVKMAEDFELLYGDGTGENLTGIYNTPGVQAYTGLSSDKYSAQVRRAMTRAILAYFQPTGVVFHPLDWEGLELETDKNGAYTVAVSVAVGGEKRVWRLNVIDTPANQQGKFLLGAFGQGAVLYDREEVNVQISTEDADNFRRNAVTIRAEERIGLEVPRPESFVAGTLTTPV